MRSLVAILPAALLAVGVANAQEGFPLDGTWRGEREIQGQHVGTVVVVMQWDGQKISGVINPGPNAITIADAKLIPAGWKVSVAAKTQDGKSISYEGTIGKL